MINSKNEDLSNKIKELAYALFDTNVLLFERDGIDINQYKDFFELEPVKKIVDNIDMVNTAINYFNNGLNTSLASANGYMHRNTMVYRLRKIKSLVGLDIRAFNDAVILKNFLLFKDYLDSQK